MLLVEASCWLFWALALLPLMIGAEFYSSINEMSKVFAYEQKMLKYVQKFIADNQSKLDFLKARLDEFEQERNEAQQWGVAYFESPLNKYLLSKRLTLDWQLIGNLMSATTGEKPLARLQHLRQHNAMPDAKELEGAIDGLLRLQSIYRLRTKHVAAGILDGVQHGTQLSAEHCLDIAQQALRDEHMQLAQAWLLEAKQRLASVNRAKLLPTMLELELQLRTHLAASQSSNTTLETTEASKVINTTQIDFVEQFEEHPPLPNDLSNLTSYELYCHTCNGHIRSTPAEERHLRCGYMTETHPFLLLAPLKVEELNLNPLLVLFHEVIYQSEIDTISQLIKNQIRRARILNHNESIVSTSRTSQYTFMPKTRHKVLQTIDQRVADMTDLNMVYAEDHQFANYGIGGHYAQHTDWFAPSIMDSNLIVDSEMGNRIATVLFYLTDVAQGGGTAFPILQKLLKPKKYAAAFWYNLHASGVGDMRTLHGACPIILGSKWVLNRWIRENVQSDHRPCHLWDDSISQELA